MDKKIKKIISKEKGVVKDTQKLLKADKKQDKIVDKAKSKLAMSKKVSTAGRKC